VPTVALGLALDRELAEEFGWVEELVAGLEYPVIAAEPVVEE
jgi:hypothetical protein